MLLRIVRDNLKTKTSHQWSHFKLKMKKRTDQMKKSMLQRSNHRLFNLPHKLTQLQWLRVINTNTDSKMLWLQVSILSIRVNLQASKKTYAYKKNQLGMIGRSFNLETRTIWILIRTLWIKTHLVSLNFRMNKTLT